MVGYHSQSLAIERTTTALQCKQCSYHAQGSNKMLKRVLTAIFLTIACAAVAIAAEFNEGAAAYKSGDFPKALQLWGELAQKGDASAQFNLGIMHDQGEGTARDAAEAARWYRLAAEQGDSSAAFNLGLMYESGDGVPRDLKQAVNWYRLAAEDGDALAQFRLGLLYSDSSEDVGQDFAEAAKWYQLAADQKHARALFNLGTMYANGKGVERDLRKANELFEAADIALMSGESPAHCTPRNTPKLEECRRRLPRLDPVDLP